MIGKELETLLLEEKIKLKELSSILDISYSTLSNYKNNVSTPDIKTLRIIKQKYYQQTGKSINLDWLITGEGEMFINSEENISKLDERVEQKVKELLTKYGLTDKK